MTTSPGYLNLPTDLTGWIGWIVMAAFLIALLGATMRESFRVGARGAKTSDGRTKRSSLITAGLFLIFLLAVPLVSLRLTYPLPVGDALPIPGTIIEPSGPTLVFLILLPSFLAAILLRAAGWLAPLAVTLIGLTAGGLLTWYDTHHIYTPLVTGLLSLLTYMALHNPYRSIEFRLLRLPLFTAAILAPLGGLLLFLSDLFVASHTYQASYIPPVTLAGRVDFAVSRFWFQWLALSSELLVAGLLTNLVTLFRPAALDRSQPLRPSPMESSLPLRLLYQMTPFVLTLLGVVLYTSWTLAGQSARSMLETHLRSSAQIVGDTIPFFLESGQNLIQYMATDPAWVDASLLEKQERLLDARLTFPFFDELYLLDEQKNTLASYPEVDFSAIATPEEMDGLDLAIMGIPFQYFTIPPRRSFVDPLAAALDDSTTDEMNQVSGAVSFMATVLDPENGEPSGILVGRANLYLNPLTHPVIENLGTAVSESIVQAGGTKTTLEFQSGEAQLVDQNGLVLYHTDFEKLFDQFVLPKEARVLSGSLDASQSLDLASIPPGDIFYEDRASDGTRRLVYYHPTPALPWAVVLSLPAHYSQQLALDIAMPTLLVILLVFLLIGTLLTLGLQGVGNALSGLVAETKRIAGGQLDHALPVTGVDEVGQFRAAFESMRRSLKARMEELNRLLTVSQQVAGSLELDKAMTAVLDAALSSGAATARLVLTESAMPTPLASGMTPRTENQSTPNAAASSKPDAEPAAIFCAQRQGGPPHGWRPQELDPQILALAANAAQRLPEPIRTMDHTSTPSIVLPNLPRLRLFNFSPGVQRPESLLAIPLRHEQEYYGVLWIAFDQPHTFSDEEVNFVSTLAGQATLAAANARLFQNAEIGRQQLASILESSADPVIVTDHQDHLLLANPAAWRLLGLDHSSHQGRPIATLIEDPTLLRLLRSTDYATMPSTAAADSTATAEINGADGRIYFAMSSTIFTSRTVDSSTARTSEGQNIPIGRVCVLRDITHFKQLDQLKSEFVSTVSHDLRSPLTLMRGYATMLEMVGTLNDQQRSYVQKIVYGVDNMARMVGNLLDLGRIEAGVELQLETIDPGELIERVVGTLQMQASQKHIFLKTELPANGLARLQVDQALFQQAIYNLVENAIKYTDPGGQVLVSTAIKNDFFHLIVRDSGIGIAPVDQPRLFEKFYRGGQRDARKRQGTGLGLAIVKSIAERHHGSVGVESQLGKGSTFWLRIPIRQPSRIPQA